MSVTLTLTVDLHSYIADPYWPERERLINIQKESGMSRARSAANRRKSLEEYLRANGMTLADYEALERDASRPFHEDAGCVVIPARQVAAMLVATCDTARAAFRPCPPDQVRTRLRPSAWMTDARVEDARRWDRFVTVTAGTGMRLSNQRALRTNWYVGAEPPDGEPGKPVTARGTLMIDPEQVDPATVENALVWAGEAIGIGASRKMGWGRFGIVMGEDH